MALEIDTDKIPEMLEEIEFSRHDDQDILTYHNKAGSDSSARKLTQHGHLFLVTKYDSADDAKIAEVFMNFYLRASHKGTEKYPSQDAILRAFRGARTKVHGMYSRRSQDKLYFTIPIAIPPGDAGVKSLEHVLGILDDVLSSPLMLTETDGPDILERSRREELDRREDRISNKGGTANRLFQQRYFPLSANLPDNVEMELIAGATLEDLTAAFQGHMEKSFPVFVFSGDVPLEDITDRIVPFCTKYSGDGKESVLSPPTKELLTNLTEPVAMYGPSQQMQFMRAFPLKSIPESEEDKLMLEVLENMLGDWTGPLYETLRHKHNLVYGVGASYDDTWNCIRIITSHAPEDYDLVVSLTGKLMKDFVNGKLSEKLFTTTKDALQGELVAQYTGGGLPCCKHPLLRVKYAISRYVNKGHDLAPMDRHKLISSLTLKDVKDAAKRYIDPGSSQIFTYSEGGDADGTD